MLYTLGLIGLALAWLLPGHHYPYTAFQQEALSAAGAWLVALGVIVGAPRPAPPLRIPAPASLALLLAAVPLVQWLAGLVPYFSDALLASTYLAAFAMCVVVGAALAGRSDTFDGRLMLAIGAGAAVSIAIGVAQWLALDPHDLIEQAVAGDRVGGNFLQPNHLACLLGMALGAVTWGFETRRLNAAAAASSAAILLAGLAMTQSRAAWLYVVARVLLWAFFRRRGMPLRVGAFGVAACAVWFVVATLLWPHLNSAAHGGGAVLTVAERLQQNVRLTHWITLSDSLLRSPWFGYGWQAISVAQEAATLDHEPTFEWIISSHSMVLDLLLWCGIPLGLAILAAILWWAFGCLRRCKDAATAAIIATIAVPIVHSLVEYPLQYLFFLLPFGLLIGTLEARLGPTGTKPGWKLPTTAYAAALLGSGVLIYGIVSQYLEIEDAVRRVRLRDAGYMLAGSAPPNVPSAPLLDQPREYLRMWVEAPTVNAGKADLGWLRKVAYRTPTPPAMTRLALTEAMNGHPQEGQRALRLMCHMLPPKHCDEGRARWAELSAKHPELAAVAYPATPQPVRK